MTGYTWYGYADSGSKENMMAFAVDCKKNIPEMKITSDKRSSNWYIRETPGITNYSVDKKFDGKTKIQIKGGVLGGTVGLLAGIHFTQTVRVYGSGANSWSSYGHTFKVYIKIVLPDGTEKIVKRVLYGLRFVDSVTQICYKKNELKKDEREAMAKRVRTNKFDQDIKIGSIVLVFNKNNFKLEYAKVDKIHKSYIEYISVTALGKTQGKKVWRCYNHYDLMYVVPNPEDVEADMALEILTNS